ncbi:MAG: hypothetical protein V2A73_17640 [Pseudomonadota bacterium]
MSACFRKLQPVDPALARSTLESARRRLGTGLHIHVYLDELQRTLVRKRTEAKGGKKP